MEPLIFSCKIRVSKEKECNGKELTHFLHLQDAVNVLWLVPKDFENSEAIRTVDRYLPNDACTTFAKEKRGDATG